jgi:hypothetical protein
MMGRLRWTAKPGRVLDFDCEARPLHWYGVDFVSKEITAIAAKFVGEKGEHVWLLGQDDPVDMLEGFRELYDQADVVTGHYIMGFDLPLISGAMTEYGLPKLGGKLAHDTKVHLIKRHGLSSSQENLGAMLGLKHPKVQMDQQRWRAANRLTAEGLRMTRERVVGDVRQHIELRQRLIDLGYLGPPRVWGAGGGVRAVAYQP